MIYTPSDPLLFVVVKVLLDFDIYSSFPLKNKLKIKKPEKKKETKPMEIYYPKLLTSQRSIVLT